MDTLTTAGPRSGTMWNRLSEAPAETAELRSVQRWMSDYLTRPDPNLGRKGPVCPYVKAAMRKDTFDVAVIEDPDPAPAELGAVVEEALEIFHSGIRADGEAVFRAVMIVLPNIIDYATIDIVHQEYKSRFVTKGLMLGQFYPGCQAPGLWNRDFRPLSTPVAMLVVRQMTVADYPFLVGREEWIFAYMTKFAPGLPSSLRQTIAEALRYDGDTVSAIPDNRVAIDGIDGR